MKEFTLTRPEIATCITAIKPNLSKFTNISDSMQLFGLLRMLETEQETTDMLNKALQSKVDNTPEYTKDGKLTNAGAKYVNDENEKIVMAKVDFKYDAFPKDYIQKMPIEMIGAIYILEQKIFE